MLLTKSLILNLYKNLYRYGIQLKYTDQSFYQRYIRNQFKSIDPSDKTKIERLYQVKQKK